MILYQNQILQQRAVVSQPVHFPVGRKKRFHRIVFQLQIIQREIGIVAYVRGKFDIVNLRIHIVHVDFMRYFRIDKDVFVRVYYKMMLFRISVFV